MCNLKSRSYTGNSQIAPIYRIHAENGGVEMTLEIENPLKDVFDLIAKQESQEEKASETTEVVAQPLTETAEATQADEVSESPDTQAESESERDSKQNFNKAIAEARAKKNEERALKEAALAEIERLRLELEATKQINTKTEIDYASDEELEVLAEEMPEVGQKIQTLQSLVKSQAEQIKQQEQAKFDAINQQLQEVENNKLKAAIEANQKLMYLQKNAPDLWEAAVEKDKLIRQLPDYKNVGYEKRFNDVVSLIELEHGVIDIPETQAQKNGSVTPPKKVINNEIPLSLSEVNGKAQVTETPTLSKATPGQVRETFKNKSSDEIIAAIRNY